MKTNDDFVIKQIPILLLCVQGQHILLRSAIPLRQKLWPLSPIRNKNSNLRHKPHTCAIRLRLYSVATIGILVSLAALLAFFTTSERLPLPSDMSLKLTCSLDVP